MSWLDDLGDLFGGSSDSSVSVAPEIDLSSALSSAADSAGNFGDYVYSATPDMSFLDFQADPYSSDLISNSPSVQEAIYPSYDQGASIGLSPTDSSGNYGDSYYGGYSVPALLNSSSASSGDIWDTINRYAKQLETPAGKLAISGLGGLTGAYGAYKQNQLLKEAAKKQAEALAARQAKASAYDSPLRLTFARQAVASPTPRNGASVFFTNNKLPSAYASGGGVHFAEGGDTLGLSLQRNANEGLQRMLSAGNIGKLIADSSDPTTYSTGIETQLACGGSTNYVRGGTAGQDDKIPAQLSDGEYIMDADIVSALGDGNNEAGAKKLDQMRAAIRTHKRSAPANKIPPKAKSPLEYMKKGAK